MRWPWSTEAALPEPELRHATGNYGDDVVDRLYELADGSADRAETQRTAGLEIAAGLYSAGFASAAVKNGGHNGDALDGLVRSQIARNLIRRGESTWLIRIGPTGRLKLLEAAHVDVYGSDPDPDTWTFRVDMGAPDGTQTLWVTAGGLLHLLYATDRWRPYRGLGPLEWASSAAALHANTEHRLGQETGAPVASLFSVPEERGGDASAEDDATDPNWQIKAKLRKATGEPLILESTAAGFGDGPDSAPPQDWVPTRLGAAPPPGLVDLYSHALRSALSACQVPPALFEGGDAAAREAYRRWVYAGLIPLADRILPAIRSGLNEPELELDFSELAAADIVGRVRALKGAVEAGMDLSAAQALTMLETD